MSTDTELLDWMTAHGASVTFGSQPDMGGRDWSIYADGRRMKQKYRSPREAIRAAIERASEEERAAGVDLKPCEGSGARSTTKQITKSPELSA
jgi:hypothetical protein